MISELLRGLTLKAVTQSHHDNTAQELGKNKSNNQYTWWPLKDV